MRSLGPHDFVVFACLHFYRNDDLHFLGFGFLRIDHNQLLKAFDSAASDTKDRTTEDTQSAAAYRFHKRTLQKQDVQQSNQILSHSSAVHTMDKKLAWEDGPSSAANSLVIDHHQIDHTGMPHGLHKGLEQGVEQRAVLQLVAEGCYEEAMLQASANLLPVPMLLLLLLRSPPVQMPGSRMGNSQPPVGASIELDQILKLGLA